ncbi:hypothetical protein EN836_24230 [Mesorhizobium sp. M1C.F.Ca.ET.193.01.1.1]|nr:hypothetical protein EN853_24220 [Mesorhizobium sp. M1C.F.Ca.ET.210.01.1.1]TGQ67282.1 hypothetical protein EN855_024230 [Mesorhizobium sp. M1C.F.Ca.ET.212.01.1.1]TGR02165.1 hypothetical protein EN847_24220 [Mesorhizobium sp. M1C.F.Ca.ET.204.01.1.1]TGR22855.1 hypothetical protein EN839_24220 [Mesorhizobium sp. M1C.F.Ca.ET.196.01.1.1]TGR45622.1 hypothetical protein EN838_24220 [Mesorhizobium sp. M1C.F.Ca.ET.195.01.1.1]TGR62504.1 hypothetical protein EN835_024215 [Mesorhizobium sp. M1C.F.Ca.ET
MGVFFRGRATDECRAPAAKLPISPLVGEMAGRPEGGAKDCDRSHLAIPVTLERCGGEQALKRRRDSAPSVLPDISPTRGEIGCRDGFRQSRRPLRGWRTPPRPFFASS